LPKELDAGEDKEGAEEVDDEVELVDEHARRGDEDGTHDERADDAPEEDAVLVGGGHGEGGEDQEENEDVIDAERLLDQVAGGPFEAFFAALEDVDADVEQQ